MSDKKHVIITGGAGFIGSHLCDKFLKEGYRITAIDNLLTGSIKNIKHLEENRNFTFVNQAVSKTVLLGLKEEKIDGILHFASPASPHAYWDYPIQTLNAGSVDVLTLLEFIKNMETSGSTRFLLASTSEIYGDPLEHPQHESYRGNVNSVGPQCMYNEAKRFAEAATMTYHVKMGINTAIVRLFNTYGPRMQANDGRVVPQFVNQVINKRPLTVNGDGSHTRSFCYIDDTVDGIYRLFNSEIHMPINIGNPEEYSILGLINVIRTVMNTDCKIIYTPTIEEEPIRRKPDISAAKHFLDWKPKIPLEAGLFNTVNYFRNTRQS